MLPYSCFFGAPPPEAFAPDWLHRTTLESDSCPEPCFGRATNFSEAQRWGVQSSYHVRFPMINQILPGTLLEYVTNFAWTHGLPSQLPYPSYTPYPYPPHPYAPPGQPTIKLVYWAYLNTVISFR